MVETRLREKRHAEEGEGKDARRGSLNKGAGRVFDFQPDTVWKWKGMKFSRTKGALEAANGPVSMPKALKTLSLIQFWSWENSLFW